MLLFALSLLLVHAIAPEPGSHAAPPLTVLGSGFSSAAEAVGALRCRFNATSVAAAYVSESVVVACKRRVLALLLGAQAGFLVREAFSAWIQRAMTQGWIKRAELSKGRVAVAALSLECRRQAKELRTV